MILQGMDDLVRCNGVEWREEASKYSLLPPGHPYIGYNMLR
jgi:hypothetical protein